MNHRNAADLRKMATDEIDLPPAHQRHPLVGIVEQFAHGDWCRRLAAEMLEVADILRRERILDEKRVIRFEILDQLHRQNGRHALVDVVEQLDVVSKLFTQVLEEPWHRADIGARFPGS